MLYGLRSYDYENARLETLFSLSATALPPPLILSEILACMSFIILMLHACLALHNGVRRDAKSTRKPSSRSNALCKTLQLVSIICYIPQTGI